MLEFSPTNKHRTFQTRNIPFTINIPYYLHNVQVIKAWIASLTNFCILASSNVTVVHYFADIFAQYSRHFSLMSTDKFFMDDNALVLKLRIVRQFL